MENVSLYKTELIDYIKNNTFKDPNSLTSSSMLFEDGFFDSMGFALLIEHLEEKFNIKTNDEDLTEENFESIDAITDYILRKKSFI